MSKAQSAGSRSQYARVISALEPRLVADLLAPSADADPVAEGEPAEGVLGSLVAVLTSREVAAATIDLHIVCEKGHERAMAALGTTLASCLPTDVTVRITPLIVGPNVGGDLGDHPEIFTPGRASALGEMMTSVLIDGVSGTPTARRALTAAADAWGVPVLLRVASTVYSRRPLGDLTSSRLLGALHFALTEPRSRENDVEILRRGYEGLVTHRNETGYRATRSLDHLLVQERSVGLPDHHSACADLLERQEEPGLAEQLRILIGHWLRHRIWSINHVHEMVLHDEAHSVAVDRNVASLCEPLLRTPGSGIEPWDVFVLALAAWLHDWGHASAHVGGFTPTDPLEVRNYHGPLTAKRLVQERGQHGITDTLIPDYVQDKKKPTYRLESEVALLCSHHQGWTSCSETAPRDDFEPSHYFSVIRGSQFTAAVADGLGINRSFADDFRHRFPESTATRDRGLQQMYKLVTLLRLADAADIGAHRVPDFDTQHTNRGAALDSLLSQIKGILTLRSTAAAQASRSEPDGQSDIEAFDAVNVSYRELLGSAKSQAHWADGEMEKRIDDVVRGTDQVQWARPAKADDPIGQQLVRWAWNYSTHVVKQVAFYQAHRQVRAVIPTLVRGRRGLDLTLFVVPMGRDEPAKDDADAALRQVRRVVVREFGVAVDENGDVVVDENDEVVVDWNDLTTVHKADLANHLQGHLGIDYRTVRAQAYVPDLRVRGEIETPPRPRALTPRSNADHQSLDWCGFGPDGPLLAPLGDTGPVGVVQTIPWLDKAYPMALSADGMHVAACVGGVLEIYEVSSGRACQRRRLTGEDATVLALRRADEAFYLVLTEASELLRIRIPVADRGSSIDRTEVASRLVGAVHIFNDVHLVTADGLVDGPRAASLMRGMPAVRCLDAIQVLDRVAWAVVPADRSGQVLVWSARRGADPHHLDDIRAEVAPVPDGRSVDDAVWVREPHGSTARLVVVRGGVPFVHGVDVAP